MDFGGMYGHIEGQPSGNPLAGGAMGCPSGYMARVLMNMTGVDWPLFYCWRWHQPGVAPRWEFGGLHGYVNGSQAANAITGMASCPGGFTSQPTHGSTGSDYPITFCWRNHGGGPATSILFGGMWGYETGALVVNPATSWSSCPAGYTPVQVAGQFNVDYNVFFCFKR